MGDAYQDNDKKAEVRLHATGEGGITIEAESAGYTSGIQILNVNGLVEITADKGDVSISANGGGYSNDGVIVQSGELENSKYGAIAKADISGVNTFITATGTGTGLRAENQKSQIKVTANGGDNTVISNNWVGIQSEYGATVEMIASAGINNVTAGITGINAWYTNSKVTLTGTNGNRLMTTGGSGYGIYSYDKGANVSLSSEAGNNVLTAAGNGIRAGSNGIVDLTANNNSLTASAYGIFAQSGGMVDFIADTGDNSITSGSSYAIFASGAAGDSTKISLDAGLDNAVSGKTWGIAASQGQVELSAKGNNQVSGTDNDGIYTYNNASVALTAAADNIVAAGTITDNFGSKYALNGLSGSTIQLSASNQNEIFGAVYTSGNSSVQIGQMNKKTEEWGSSASNYVASSAVVGTSEASGNEKNIVSALYAGDGADITVKGEQNTILSSVNSTVKSDSEAVERTIWASKGGSIEIDGMSIIRASQAGKENAIGIALAAGTGDLNEDIINSGKIPDELPGDRSTITLNYGTGSQITGDIVSGYGGNIMISSNSQSASGVTRETAHDLSFTGDALASNGGQLTIDLGNNGYWEGRADSYKDADNSEWREAHTDQFAPEFSKGIYSSGNITVDMGTGSYWNVTGQSWVNSLKGTGAVDLRGKDTGGYAIHIGEITGEHTFIVDLDTTGSSGDMIYIWKGTNDTQTLEIANRNEVLESLAPGERVRFATIGNAGGGFTSEGMDTEGPASAGNEVSTFGTMTQIRDAGVYNVDFHIEYDPYGEDGATESEDERYNGAGSAAESKLRAGDNQLGEEESANTRIMLLDTTGSDEEDESTENGEAGSNNLDKTTNFRLVGIKNATLSHAGQTVINMSKVNYSNAVYMDRLNKRMGEARYLDGDDGLWVRLRHDRIGKEDAFRSMNTMMELGYEWKAKGQKDGEHRQGVAFDYMRGTADYTNVMGDGDVRRAGVWLYDTWLGDKGHYTDYVLKYGHLSNDFDIFSEMGEEINGDYSNDVWSASAEYGRKKDIGNEWYFEPQAQMQYAYVTSADYTTSQGTKVELDGIDSLIGRAGFRLGRDTSEGNTVYFKADILHEFLGDQDIHAIDTTTNGVLSTTYENEGTWYDVGFGFSHRMGKDSYMFLDLEHSFGNDNDETYQINIGLSKAF